MKLKLFEVFERFANPNKFKDEERRKAEEAQRANEQAEAMRKAAKEAELKRLEQEKAKKNK